jgi:hypothetical protein
VINRKGDTAGAKAELEKARDCWSASLGPDHPQTGVAIQYIAELAKELPEQV